ncbi:MAG: hypothetical protein Harvfovirus6_39 [Harvfovirus sp.]|uniref:Uncharacterized protein n=1 Tax=Harvfovirus sp. TaxID=2487768 RepID=A0A3G5A5M5_9VIRU|nr:MAG: hypothetical protein Harvfovirus6_39 [Harvfovirus sp.]
MSKPYAYLTQSTPQFITPIASPIVFDNPSNPPLNANWFIYDATNNTIQFLVAGTYAIDLNLSSFAGGTVTVNAVLKLTPPVTGVTSTVPGSGIVYNVSGPSTLTLASNNLVAVAQFQTLAVNVSISEGVGAYTTARNNGGTTLRIIQI